MRQVNGFVGILMTGLLGVLALATALATALTSAPTNAQANVLVTDVSKDQISIRSNFSGETLLLFGAIDTAPHGAVDGVVVVLRGPAENITLRKKQKQVGIWVNGPAYHLGPLPGFYAVASSTAPARLAPENELNALGIGAASLSANVLSGVLSDAEKTEALAAYRRLRRHSGLLNEDTNAVTIIDDKLFRVEINLPAGMPVGRYVTEFFAFKKGRLVGYRTGELPVDIVGAGHALHKAAYEQSLLYGVCGVVLAMVMGWGVAVMFRRR